MRLGYALFIGLLYLSVSPLCVSQSIPKLEQVLPGIQDHIKEFELSLPDFICDERITSRELMGGKVNHETFIESEFRGTQSQGHDTPFIESREIKMIDGRTAPKNQQLAGPFFFGGGFSSIVAEIFSRKNRPYFDFKISGTEAVDGKAALVIKFKARNNQKVLLYREMFGAQVVFKGSGKALIDPESMNVMRLEVQFLDPPIPEGVLSLSVDYAGVEINGKTFWMPKTVTLSKPCRIPRCLWEGNTLQSTQTIINSMFLCISSTRPDSASLSAIVENWPLRHYYCAAFKEIPLPLQNTSCASNLDRSDLVSL